MDIKDELWFNKLSKVTFLPFLQICDTAQSIPTGPGTSLCSLSRLSQPRKPHSLFLLDHSQTRPRISLCSRPRLSLPSRALFLVRWQCADTGVYMHRNLHIYTSYYTLSTAQCTPAIFILHGEYLLKVGWVQTQVGSGTMKINLKDRPVLGWHFPIVLTPWDKIQHCNDHHIRVYSGDLPWNMNQTMAGI